MWSTCWHRTRILWFSKKICCVAESIFGESVQFWFHCFCEDDMDSELEDENCVAVLLLWVPPHFQIFTNNNPIISWRKFWFRILCKDDMDFNWAIEGDDAEKTGTRHHVTIWLLFPVPQATSPRTIPPECIITQEQEGYQNFEDCNTEELEPQHSVSIWQPLIQLQPSTVDFPIWIGLYAF